MSVSAATKYALRAMYERLVIPDQELAEEEIPASHRWWTFAARFNVAPAQSVPIVRMHEGKSEAVMMRWGFVPPPGKDPVTRLGAAHVSSRVLQSSKDFGKAWLHSQRCIVPVAGFYVWQRAPQGFRRPFYVRLVNRDVFGVAAVWARAVTLDDDVIESCALVIVSANRLMAEIDNISRRMPAILSRESYSSWLTARPDEARALLRTHPSARMVSHPVSPRVNSLKYDDPDLIRPAT
jgi:putative SOS response-associated peptidase YedK